MLGSDEDQLQALIALFLHNGQLLDPPEPADRHHFQPGQVEVDVRITGRRIQGEQHLTITSAETKRLEPDRPGLTAIGRRLVLKEPDQVRKLRNLHSGYIIGSYRGGRVSTAPEELVERTLAEQVMKQGVPVHDVPLMQTVAGGRRVFLWSAYRVMQNGQVMGALCS